MAQLLSFGCTGPLVRDLQEKLNLLPSKLIRLVVDGSFGTRTKMRVMEFQQMNSLSADGVVGPMTWEKLIELLANVTITGSYQNNFGRMAVVAIAKVEAGQGNVFAKLPLGKDPQKPKPFRWGYEKLLKYFRLAAPKDASFTSTYFNEDAIRYLDVQGQLYPMPHWCGIFALWAIKMAGMPVGIWKIGNGISAVPGFQQINANSVAAGDVGYVHNPFEHHFIIEEIFDQNGVKVFSTIEGNSSPNSNFSFKKRYLSEINAFYSCFPAPAKAAPGASLFPVTPDDWAYRNK